MIRFELETPRVLRTPNSRAFATRLAVVVNNKVKPLFEKRPDRNGPDKTGRRVSCERGTITAFLAFEHGNCGAEETNNRDF